MRTHVELDDEVLDQVLALGGFPSKKAAVNAALGEYLNTLKRLQLQWKGDLVSLRQSRSNDAGPELP